MFSGLMDPFWGFSDPWSFGLGGNRGGSNTGGGGRQGGRRGGDRGQNLLGFGGAGGGGGTIIPRGVEDFGLLGLDELMNEPLNLQVLDKDNEYELIARKPPHLRKKDLHVEVNGNVLTISGERLRHRRRRGTEKEEYISFSRSIVLPDDVNTDNIIAKYDEQGNLHVEVPKVAEKGPKTIPIEGQKPTDTTMAGTETTGGAAEKSSGATTGTTGMEKTEEQKATEPRAGQEIPIR